MVREFNIVNRSPEKAKKATRKSAAVSPAERAPHGRDEVMSAVLEAAAELFAERSPAQVSVREIAARAGVNHALVHRHFGTKSALLTAVIREAAQAYEQSIAGAKTPGQAFRQGFLYGTEKHPQAAALARAVLDGSVPRGIDRPFPAMREHITLIETAAEDGSGSIHNPEVIAAGAFAFMSGWFILEGWLVRAAGLRGRALDAVRSDVADMLEAMVDRESGVQPNRKSSPAKPKQ
jgi:AcrR family transcriptional regulator